MEKKIVCTTACAEEIARVLEKHKIRIMDMENVLNTVKQIVMFSTFVQIEEDSFN